MALDLVLKLKDEKDLTCQAQEERNARDATAIAYAGKTRLFPYYDARSYVNCGAQVVRIRLAPKCIKWLSLRLTAKNHQTYSLLQTFLCAMAMHPECQKRAREELDVVVGPNRLPTFDDYDALPYIQAIIMECSRWLPVVPMGHPHRAIKDGYYDGYFIPEGTVIMIVSMYLSNTMASC